jgi:endonuclease/exonuclease/phosphatase family metal-dependent hydrolase
VTSWAVTTWNLHGSARPPISRAAAAIRAESPDIVAIQEIQQRQAAELAAILSMRYSWVVKHHPYTRLVGSRSEGMAIMTPHLLDAVGHTELTEGQPMRSWRRRIAQWGLVGRVDRSIVMIYNTHLSPHDDADAADSRRREALRLSEIVAAIGDDPSPIVAGDFNDADDPTIIQALPGVEHVRPPYTNPADDPMQVLDHVLLPDDASDVTVTVPPGGVDWAAISDHLPVTVRFTLPIPPGVRPQT